MNTFNVSNNALYKDSGLIINKDVVLSPKDIAEYKSFIDSRIEKVLKDGKVAAGNLYVALHQPRRGWIIRGLHYDIAEKSIDHSRNLDIAAYSFAKNPNADHLKVEIDGLNMILKAHDNVDAIFFDITPDDKILKTHKREMELYGISKLYGYLDSDVGNVLLAYHNRFEAKSTRGARVGGILDRGCAVVRSRDYRNKFDEVRDFYKDNVKAKDWLLEKIHPEFNNLDDALLKTHDRLGEFYSRWMDDGIDEPFFNHVYTEIENFKGANVYQEYFNLLSTTPVSDFK